MPNIVVLVTVQLLQLYQKVRLSMGYVCFIKKVLLVEQLRDSAKLMFQEDCLRVPSLKRARALAPKLLTLLQAALSGAGALSPPDSAKFRFP